MRLCLWIVLIGNKIYYYFFPTLCRKPAEGTLHPVVINIDDLTFDWVDAVKAAMTAHQEVALGHTIWLISENLPQSGIIGMINCLKQEPGGDRIR